MITLFRNGFCAQLFWGMMAIYLLNISVDTPDPKPETVAEDLSINDQESIVEIVVEEILGYEDAIQEFDDPDTENNYKKTNLKIDLGTHNLASTINSSFFQDAGSQTLPAIQIGLPNGFQQLNTPPPKS